MEMRNDGQSVVVGGFSPACYATPQVDAPTHAGSRTPTISNADDRAVDSASSSSATPTTSTRTPSRSPATFCLRNSEYRDERLIAAENRLRTVARRHYRGTLR
jgi:hypothetical protein